jgi:hypothetical protein
MDDSLDISAVDEIVEEDDNDVEYEDIPDQAKEKCKRLQISQGTNSNVIVFAMKRRTCDTI